MFGVFLLQIAGSTLGAALNDAAQFGFRTVTQQEQKDRQALLDDIGHAVSIEVMDTVRPELEEIKDREALHLQVGTQTQDQVQRLHLQNQTTLAVLGQIDAEAVQAGAEGVRQVAKKSAQARIDEILAEVSTGQIREAAPADIRAAKTEIDRVDDEMDGVVAIDFTAPENGQEAESKERTGTNP